MAADGSQLGKYIAGLIKKEIIGIIKDITRIMQKAISCISLVKQKP